MRRHQHLAILEITDDAVTNVANHELPCLHGNKQERRGKVPDRTALFRTESIKTLADNFKDVLLYSDTIFFVNDKVKVICHKVADCPSHRLGTKMGMARRARSIGKGAYGAPVLDNREGLILTRRTRA